MANCLIARDNWVWEGTPAWSNGSWVLPLDNLATLDTRQYARSTSAAASATRLRVDLGAIRRSNVIALLGLNVTGDATIEATGLSGVPDVEQYFTTGSIGDVLEFSRASGATYWDADGVLQIAATGAPRFDHDPANSNEPLGVLLEGEPRTNMIAYSKDGDQWVPQFDNVIDADFATAPDGTQTFAKVFQAAAGFGSAFHGVAFLLDGTPSNSMPTAFSFTAKYAGNQWLIARPYTGNTNLYAHFDLLNGVVGNVHASASARMTALGDGRYRCEVLFTTHSSAGTANASCWLAQSNGTNPNPQFVGDGASGALITDVQWEECDQDLQWASSAIPTAGAAATRASETLGLSGTPFLEVFQSAAAGAAAIECSFRSEPPGPVGLFKFEGSGSRAIHLSAKPSDDDVRLTIHDGSSSQADIETSTTFAWNGTPQLAAAAWATNDAICAHAGGLSAQDTSVTLPTLHTLTIQSDGGGSSQFPCHVRWFAYWSRRVTDAQLQAGTVDRLDFDSTVPITGGPVAAYPVTHAPSGGYIPWGHASADGKQPAGEADPRGVTWALYVPDGVDARYVDIQISDEANPAGYVQAYMLWVGFGEVPQVGIADGLQVVPVEEARKSRSLAGTFRGRRLWKRKRMVGALRMQDEDVALATWLEMGMKNGGTAPALIMVYPGAAGIHQDRLTMVGVFDTPTPVEHETFRYYGTPFAATQL
ncbi:MAG: hypothetical protein AB7O45_12405 [Alphaproteobacteria bacterium]